MSIKTIVVTGASKGIGLTLSESLLEKGHQVYGLSRSQPENLISHANYHPVVIDLKDESAVAALARMLSKTLLNADALIHCAGYGEFHELEQFSSQKIMDLMQVNLLSPMLLSRALIASLKKQKGKLIFLGSEADHTPHKKGTIYCASKFGLRGFVKSLRLECVSNEVGVTLISPGLVDTSFYETLDFKPGEDVANSIQADQIVETILMALDMESNACIEEIHVAPMKHVVRKK